MFKARKQMKVAVIAALVAVISILHYGALHGNLGLHILHRELYFIPILLASFWFGLRPGVLTAVVVSLIYAPHIFIYSDPHGYFVTVASQVIVFILVAVVLGWLSDRQKRQQEEILQAENLAVLGRAAVAVGYEMKDVLGALNKMFKEPEGLQCTEVDRDFYQEMARLERMVTTLSSFAPQERIETISHDLNEIIRQRLEQHLDAAREADVRLESVLDDSGCPSMVDANRIGWVLDTLIKNALEVSEPGQTIWIRSHRGGSHCRVEIEDQGQGIRPEHVGKIFTPFFTTKAKGTGLGLAACKKILRDLGGNITVTSTLGKGATFVVSIPREQRAAASLAKKLTTSASQ
ncbi:MAG: histidine kinase [Deltaproteobacteria bacterium]|nr:histidine kinase [Deltaproteobacteria bacterium]MBW2070140.1 histidine kinase [Deltaproteobacteria bacterium]